MSYLQEDAARYFKSEQDDKIPFDPDCIEEEMKEPLPWRARAAEEAARGSRAL